MVGRLDTCGFLDGFSGEFWIGHCDERWFDKELFW